jgi:hypothetical protein
MKFKDIVNKISEDQYVISNLLGDRPFAITESTPNSWKPKMISIDFQDGDVRAIEADTMILVLVELYGKDYILDLLSKLKRYEDIKDIEINCKE